jgi:hypothetical protein
VVSYKCTQKARKPSQRGVSEKNIYCGISLIVSITGRAVFLCLLTDLPVPRYTIAILSNQNGLNDKKKIDGFKRKISSILSQVGCMICGRQVGRVAADIVVLTVPNGILAIDAGYVDCCAEERHL